MKIILSFTLPIFIGNVFQQFYNMADAVIVGKFVGNKALAAVGSTEYGYDHVSDLWVCSRHDCGIYRTYGTEIRSRRYEKHAQDSSRRRGVILYCGCSAYRIVYGIHETSSDFDEYAV